MKQADASSFVVDRFMFCSSKIPILKSCMHARAPTIHHQLSTRNIIHSSTPADLFLNFFMQIKAGKIR
jgi:hypothetical protein